MRVARSHGLVYGTAWVLAGIQRASTCPERLGAVVLKALVKWDNQYARNTYIAHQILALITVLGGCSAGGYIAAPRLSCVPAEPRSTDGLRDRHC